ncbi:Reverse transcriptase (RNA-dependent DNA polymerase) [Nesidiocoris tenuis]|uniref:Reverse transcriptase (RNA-dependent DNA polymerase) n=1 Tax=Nesidiocoris tenuis TaxID=355587 RepID=A0ABN7AAW5_9HEMI|nr:Reverse transcriptase (RNA-dependent DNA polymerase) [Nesidiocoris tenuis]
MQYAEPFITSSILDEPFAMAELGAVLGSVKDHKAPGSDGIPFEFFKYVDKAFLEHILDYFNGILETGVVPEAFKEAAIFPLFKKKGDPGDAANYRGLSFVNCLSKLFTSLLANRLSLFVNEGGLLSECQNGFRKGYSTVDAIFTLCGVVRLRLSRPRGKLYAFFVDLRAAFDTVDRGLLFYKLLGMGVSHRMVRVLRSLYSGVTSSVWTRDGATGSFPVGVGVRQGCPLSPLLFALYINNLTDVIVRGVLVGGHQALDVCGRSSDSGRGPKGSADKYRRPEEILRDLGARGESLEI